MTRWDNPEEVVVAYRIVMAETFHFHPRDLDEMTVSELDGFTREIDRRIETAARDGRRTRR